VVPQDWDGRKRKLLTICKIVQLLALIGFNSEPFCVFIHPLSEMNRRLKDRNTRVSFLEVDKFIGRFEIEEYVYDRKKCLAPLRKS
jgi:hypothetical protein